MLAYVLLLSKYVLTAYDQPSFSLHLNGFTDQSLAVSFITELWLLCYNPVMGAIIDQPQILLYQDVPSLWGRGGGGGGGGWDEG